MACCRGRTRRPRPSPGQALQAEYAAWLEALPAALRGGTTGEVLQTIADLDLAELIAIEPPRGFARD